ncbi:elongation factor P hydroxylase [Marinobacter sp. ASW11-75]|uniref:Elongation factor P hydroxylase n=2 Tax=Marinobacteraceae TaxID=2887365 RepID=A0ABU5P0Y6_9GAMM|nr:elongation factor P hydroxylase [Marinobacter sp. ASW11-75]MEA1081728.1 elongation factor P hydroxylase [Marinobacter sp. ASW11-75]MEE3118161.1 elongation factor P hydroxylase [Pseudomonadota bacterium]
MNHSSNDLIMLFNDLFRETHRTVLVKGSGEPEYIPAEGTHGLAQVVFAHGYYASALHEISHWCIAGAHRRTLHDYGYWYCPDGRTAEQQRAFEQVEVKPQALEWLFATAAGSRFHISLDNLSGDGGANERTFRRNVCRQAEHYLATGLPRRAAAFAAALKRFYGTTDSWLANWRQDLQRIAPPGFEPNHSRETETV